MEKLLGFPSQKKGQHMKVSRKRKMLRFLGISRPKFYITGSEVMIKSLELGQR